MTTALQGSPHNLDAVYYLNRRAAGTIEDDQGKLAEIPELPEDPKPEDCQKYLKAHPDWMAEALGVDIEGRPPGGPPFTLLTADDILATDWPEPVWAVPDLLPVGLAILAGKPKAGKSWLALQVAQAVGAGGVALGKHVERGSVLYLALEDPPRRLQERMVKQHWPRGLPVEFMPMGRFIDEVGDLRNGGGERLARQIQARRYRLVVIDTLSRSVPGDQNDVADMTIALTPLQEMAHTHNCAVVLVDHHKKGNGFDPDAISDILGSTAKGAMTDTAWGLYRESGKAGAKLAIIGRDVEVQTLALTFDGVTGCWQCEGDADKLEITENRQAILDAVEGMGRASLMEVAEAVDRNKGSVYRDLQDMVAAGLLAQRGRLYEAVL
ncbi:MAG: AAA family ATPase [Anaerolineae bacterium]|nr:AAA family ATPase [Anaerolineae bacterium]